MLSPHIASIGGDGIGGGGGGGGGEGEGGDGCGKGMVPLQAEQSYGRHGMDVGVSVDDGNACGGDGIILCRDGVLFGGVDISWVGDGILVKREGVSPT
jgi:hypothetical protein